MSKAQATDESAEQAEVGAWRDPVFRVLDWQGRRLPWLAQMTHIPYDRLWRIAHGRGRWEETERLAVACALQVPPELLWPPAAHGTKTRDAA